MFIKYIVINRYKSYRELSYMDPLSPKINIIIGPNGNGKSNFLDSIIFVLTDKYQNMRQEDKKLLLHEDIEDISKTISIELVFDNKSRRFPVDKDTVSIIKKYDTKDNREEILINQKKLLKSDISNLLESAGFSRSNPYYIIQQGKINMFINMNDYEYYEIFSEVTGTKTYEEKKEESLKILDECKENKEKIIKQKNEIQEHIEKLNVQCNDLKEFGVLEEKRKAIEAFILNEQVASIQMDCQILLDKKEQNVNIIQNLSNKQNNIKLNINSILNEINKKNKLIESLKNKIKKCKDEINEIEKIKFKNEFNLKNINNEKNNFNIEYEKIINDLKNFENSKFSIQNQIETLTNKIKSIDISIENKQKEYNENKGQSDILLLKSTNEKNAYISNEIQKLNISKNIIENSLLNIENEIKENLNKKNSFEQIIKNLENENIENNQNIQNLNNLLIKSKNNRRDIINNIKKNDIEINEISDDIQQITENINKIKLTFPNFETFNTINQILNMKIEGVYGILLDIFNIDKIAKNAVDLILKDKLYSIICDSLETANKILEINRKLNGPVINIIPLDFINEDDNENNDENNFNYKNISQQILTQLSQSNELNTILDFIKINNIFSQKIPEKYKNKLNFLLKKNFGHCQLVKNYEIGMKYAKKYNFTCVTSQNEIIYNGGFITKVGFYDFNKQRINLYEKLNEKNEYLKDLNFKMENLKKIKNENINNENEIIREQQKLFQNKNNFMIKLEENNNNKNFYINEINNLNKILMYQNNEKEKKIQEKNDLIQKFNVYNSLLNNNNIENNTQKFNINLNNLEKDLKELSIKKNEFLKQKIENENELNNNINKKINELENKINLFNIKKDIYIQNNLDEKDNSDNLKIINFEIENYTNAIKKYTNEIKNISIEISELNENINKNNEINEKFNKEINIYESELKKNVLMLNDKNEKKNKLLNDITKCGNISKEEMEKLNKLKEKSKKNINQNVDNIFYLQQILKPFYKLLEECNENMKKFDKINRFALDDYKIFNDKKNQIDNKLIELEEDEKKLLKMIKVLDERKENAIITTFNKVKNSFEEFFNNLVPNGKATLELNQENKTLHINVNFNNNNENSDKFQDIHQLSGGQKSAVAIALIFALSKIDPPPFYILDEVDAALDPNLRINLSKLIQKLGENNQFIISTFKPELLSIANNIYQIKFINKTSRVNLINYEEANSFLQENF